jgi:hypothetical protein
LTKPGITLRVYAHCFRKDDSKAAAAINAALSSQKSIHLGRQSSANSGFDLLETRQCRVSSLVERGFVILFVVSLRTGFYLFALILFVFARGALSSFTN